MPTREELDALTRLRPAWRAVEALESTGLAFFVPEAVSRPSECAALLRAVDRASGGAVLAGAEVRFAPDDGSLWVTTRAGRFEACVQDPVEAVSAILDLCNRVLASQGDPRETRTYRVDGDPLPTALHLRPALHGRLQAAGLRSGEPGAEFCWM